jgi:F-type H+-transporting ATPase subunit delta
MTARAAAVRYARALFDVALKEGDIQQAGRDLGEFSRLVASHDLLARVLTNPAVPAARKRGVVESLLARTPRLSPIVAKLLILLAERDRLVLLPDVATAYDARLMDHARVVRAQVTTAVPLPPDRIAALRDGLARATGRQVQLEAHVDPAIIGGAVARIGSTVYDGSVTTHLARVKQRLTTAATD